MLDQFYTDILIPDSQLVVATLSGKKIQHYVLDDSSEVIPFLSQYEEYNTYHSFGAYKGLTNKRPGKGELKGLPGCTGVRSWGFDLDVGDKPTEYPSVEAAFEALQKAIELGQVPEPTWIMFSGGGIQFTYVLGGKFRAKGLPEKVWKACFQAMRTHFLQYLKIDRAVGSYPYKLLRSPCTPNWKYKPPTQPLILNEERGPYLDLEYLKALKPSAAKPATERKDTDVHRVENPVHLHRVGAACPAIQEQIDTGGEHAIEPIWLATGNICAHTFQYRDGFHELSEGHAEYDREATDAKFDHIKQNVADGPMGCENFGSTTDPESVCYNCPAYEAGARNPITATRNAEKKASRKLNTSKPKAEDPEPDTEAVLEEISEHIEGDFHELAITEDGDKIMFGVNLSHLPTDAIATDDSICWSGGLPICSRFMVKGYSFNDRDNKGSVAISRTNGRTWMPLPASSLGSPAALHSELANLGVRVFEPKPTHHYVSAAAFSDKNILERRQFGWDEDFTSFYTPTELVGEAEFVPGPQLQAIHKSWGGKEGSLDKWLEGVKIYERQGQEPYLMALLTSLASPLLAYYGLEKGVILSLTGLGGAGKTSALQVASSVWGRGVSSLIGTASTSVALRAAIATCSHLPMVYDDITQMTVEDLKQLALEISQGNGRARGKIDGSLNASESWQLAFLTTSNTSLHQKLAELIDQGNADMNRVIELRIEQSRNVSLEQGSELVQVVQDNYGHIGHELIKHVLLLDRDKEVTKTRKLRLQLKARDGLKGSDRFVDSLIVACYRVHKTVKQLHPSFPGDPEEMFTWMRTQLRENNRNIHQILEIRVPDLDDFITAYAVENLIISKMGAGYEASGNSLKGYIYDNGDTYLIPRDVFNGWCRRGNLKSRTVLDKWGYDQRIVNQGGVHQRTNWSAKSKEGIIIDGALVYPSLIIARKNHGTIEAERTARTGNVTAITQAAKNN